VESQNKAALAPTVISNSPTRAPRGLGRPEERLPVKAWPKCSTRLMQFPFDCQINPRHLLCFGLCLFATDSTISSVSPHRNLLLSATSAVRQTDIEPAMSSPVTDPPIETCVAF
jgi:hypothetical protein